MLPAWLWINHLTNAHKRVHPEFFRWTRWSHVNRTNMIESWSLARMKMGRDPSSSENLGMVTKLKVCTITLEPNNCSPAIWCLPTNDISLDAYSMKGVSLSRQSILNVACYLCGSAPSQYNMPCSNSASLHKGIHCIHKERRKCRDVFEVTWHIHDCTKISG